MEQFGTEVAGRVIAILRAAGLGWPAALVAAVVLAVALALLVRAGAVRLPGDATPHDSLDDSAPATDRPPSTWGQNDGPPGGGMEGG